MRPSIAALGAWVLAAFPTPARADLVLHLADQLARGSLKVRLQSSLLLARTRDPRAVPALASALSDSEEAVRAGAALALGRLGVAAAVVPLRKALQDPSPWVRREVARALDALAAPGPAPAAEGAARAPAPVAAPDGGTVVRAKSGTGPRRILLEVDETYHVEGGRAPATDPERCQNAVRTLARNPHAGRRRLLELVWTLREAAEREDAAEVVGSLRLPGKEGTSKAEACCAPLDGSAAKLKATVRCLADALGRAPAREDPPDEGD